VNVIAPMVYVLNEYLALAHDIDTNVIITATQCDNCWNNHGLRLHDLVFM